MIGDPFVLGIVLVALIIAILLLIWDYRADRSMRTAIRDLEVSIQENSETISGMLTETQLLIEQLEKTLSTELDANTNRIGTSIDKLVEITGGLENDHPSEEDEQPPKTAIAGSITELDAEKAKVLFTNLRHKIPLGEEGISQLRMNYYGPAPNSSPANPLHQFKTVKQVGDFIAFSAGTEQTYLFPNPEVGESATAFGQVFPKLKEGDFSHALEELIPLRIEPHDEGSWVSVE